MVKKLANINEIEAAYKIAKELFEILPPERIEIDLGDNVPFKRPANPRIKFEYFYLKELIDKQFTSLLIEKGIDFLIFLCDQLNNCLCYQNSESESSPPQDFSKTWRPAIEDIDSREPSDTNEIFVSFVRNVSEYLIKKEIAKIENVKEIFAKYDWFIFDRIYLHLLRLFMSQAEEEVIQAILNRKFFKNDIFNREYALLLKGGFNLLGRKEKEEIYDWIKEGPDISILQKSSRTWATDKVSDKYIEKFKKRWKLKRLNWISDNLPSELNKLYDELVSEFGRPESPLEIVSPTYWGGYKSPLSIDELDSMSVPDIVEYLRGWVPKVDKAEMCPEGLGRSLKVAVKNAIRKFAIKADLFKGLDPTYIRSLLIGLKDALNQEIPFDWSPVISLCEWILSQPREIKDRTDKKFRDRDPDWGDTRRSIADLFSIGFIKWDGSFSFSDREAVWKILEKLSEDPDPTPEDESTYCGSNMDPATYSLNTVRGETIHSIIKYALWVHRNLKEKKEKSSGETISFEDMPEVRGILEEHLDISNDSSIAIRSIYGRCFQALYFIDYSWAKSNVNLIFPLDTQGSDRLFLAVWDTYVTHCSAQEDSLDLLKKQYLKAIEFLGYDRKAYGFADPDEKLAEHLMTYYWWGKLDSGSYDKLLSTFWEKANADIRGYAIQYIGKNLYDLVDEIETEILIRLKKLWESRIANANSSCNKEEYISEMESFGLWFASNKFEAKWSLEQLLSALEISGKCNSDKITIEAIKDSVEIFPIQSTKCLELMIRGDKTGWSIHKWKNDARYILEKALETPEAAEISEVIINYIGSRGFHDFRDLL